MRLIVLAAAWLLGLYLGARFHLPLAVLASLIPLGLLLALLLRRRWRPLLAALFALGAFGGMLRFDLHERSQAETLAEYHGNEVSLRGRVASSPELRGPVVKFRVAATELSFGGEWRPVSGSALVTARPTRELAESRDAPYLRLGDVLWLKGKLESPQPFDDFDFPAYLAHQGVRSVMAFPRLSLLGSEEPSLLRRLLLSTRSRLSTSLERALPEPQNGLAQAIAIGVRSGLPEGLSRDFNESGTSHLLAVSGLNVAIVLGVALALSRRMRWGLRVLVYLAPAVAVWLYACLAGLSPSAQRAAVMGTFYLAALALGRQRHGLEALLLAAFAITVVNPLALWQISFQLSFLAMAGIVLAALPLLEYVTPPSVGNRGVLGSLAQAGLAMLAMGVAATLFTWPAVAFYFQRVSLVGIPATALALPALPFALVASLLTALIGLASLEASWAFGWAAWLALSYTVWVVQLSASLPLASLRLEDMAQALVWVYYAGLGSLLWAIGSLRELQAKLAARLPRLALTFPQGPAVPRFYLFSATLAALAAAVWWTALAQPRHRLEATALDVGRGEAILLKAPSGRTALVDGGGDPRALRQALGAALPFRSRRIDLVIATHAHQDHIGGLAEGLRGYRVGAALLPPAQGESAALALWQRALESRRIPRLAAEAGQLINLGGGARLEVLHPPARPLVGTESDVDNNSVVVRASYGKVSLLLTGDIRALAEQYLVQQRAGLQSTVLKVAHHGSRSSTTPEFLAGVRPSAAVISAEAENPFGHPHDAAMQRLLQHVPERAIFFTGRDGWVRFSTDGERLWVRTEHK